MLQGTSDGKANPHHFTRRQALLLLAHLVGDIHQPLHVGNAFIEKNGQFLAPKNAAQIDSVTVFNSNGGNNLLLDEVKLTAISSTMFDGTAAMFEPLAGAVKLTSLKPVASSRAFHSYWDSTVVDYALRRMGARTPSQFAKMIIKTTPPRQDNTGNPVTWPCQWADDTLRISKLAYADISLGKISEKTDRQGETHFAWALDMPPAYPLLSSAIAQTQLINGGYHLASLLQTIWP